MNKKDNGNEIKRSAKAIMILSNEKKRSTDFLIM